MNLTTPAVYLAALSSVSGTLAGALGVPSFFSGPSASPADAPSADLGARTRSPIIVTPLSSPCVTFRLRFVSTGVLNTFTIFTDGQADFPTELALEHFMHCRRTGRELALAPGILALLGSVAQHWPERVINIVSAFRSRPFGVPHSKHFIGHAIDLRVEGVKTAKLRDFLWREHHEVGVGYYFRENFVHLDWRPGEPDAAWSAGHEDDTPDNNPRWARSARRPSGRHPCEVGCS